MFFKKNQTNNTTKKIDKIVTGLIIGGALAGAIGLAKTEKGKQITNKIKQESPGVLKQTHDIFGGALVKVLSLFDDKK